MLFVPFVNALLAIVYLLNSYFIDAHPAFLLFGSFLSCFYGEFQGVIALCYAYLADVTRDTIDHRTMRMAFIEASLSFAGIPAGLLSGYLLQQIGYVSVFCLTIGINVLILLYVACLLPDANRPETNQVCSRTNLLSQQCNEASNTVINTKSRTKCFSLYKFKSVQPIPSS